jgi:haloalkane dehalogenase
MGNSGPAAGGRYRLVDHHRYLDAWVEALALNVILVVPDGGCALGLGWARRTPTGCAGPLTMEAIVRRLRWGEGPDASRGLFQAFRSSAGESLIRKRNLFVQRVLPGASDDACGPRRWRLAVARFLAHLRSGRPASGPS